MSIAHYKLFSHVADCPDREVQGHGSMSYTPNGYWTGRLPRTLSAILSDLRTRQTYIPMIYSYGTPIAWFDREHGVWVKPDVAYSITTGRQQSYIRDAVSIPWDCGLEEYKRYVSLKMVYSRWGGIKPGPSWTLD